MPAAAQRVLLKQLADAGAKLFYHGDFDWAGIHISNNVIRLCAAKPFRFQSNDYSQAFGSISPKERDLSEITVTASWDASLGAIMQLHGRAISEEAIAALLVEDLRSSQALSDLVQ